MFLLSGFISPLSGPQGCSGTKRPSREGADCGLWQTSFQTKSLTPRGGRAQSKTQCGWQASQLPSHAEASHLGQQQRCEHTPSLTVASGAMGTEVQETYSEGKIDALLTSPDALTVQKTRCPTAVPGLPCSPHHTPEMSTPQPVPKPLSPPITSVIADHKPSIL